jgi:hypothetical protein
MTLPALLAAALLSQAGGPPWLTGVSQPDDLEIWMVTFGPGDSVPEWWGHTALVVQDRRLNQGRLYNYGMFAFDEGFLARFVKGHLDFWVGEDPILPTFHLYKTLNRDVRIQELNLTPVQRLQVAHALAVNVLPQNRMYLYDHYLDNCSTRPRDIFDQAVGLQLTQATSAPSVLSLRELTRKYSRVSPPMLFVLDFMQNDRLDKPMPEKGAAFLPDGLERQVQKLQLRRDDGTTVPAVKKQWNWYTSTRPPVPDEPPHWTPAFLGLGVALAALALALGHWGRGGKRLPRALLGLEISLLGLFWGLLGTALVLGWAFTNNVVTHHNENLFLANPITLAALPCGVMLAFGSSRGRRASFWIWMALGVTTVIGLLAKALPWLDQNNWNVIALIAPVNLGLAALFWLDRRAGAKAAAT